MAKVAAFLLLGGLLSCTIAVSCPDMYKKIQSGNLSYLAEFNFTIPVSTTPESGWALALRFSQEFISIGAYGGVQIESNGLGKWASIFNSSGLVKGNPFSQKFRIYWNLNITEPPELVDVTFQTLLVCPK